jgi:hypothetical protein
MSAQWILQFPTGQTQLVLAGGSNLVSYFAANGPSVGWTQLWSATDPVNLGAPAIALNTNNEAAIATATGDGSLLFWLTIPIPPFNGDQEIPIQIAPAGAVGSVVGMQVFPDGQAFIVAVGQSGGLYAYSSETLSSNTPSAPIPGAASVQGGATMAVSYAIDPSGQATAANISVLAAAPLQPGNSASTVLQLFTTTYEIGSHAPIQSWQWGSVQLPGGVATLEGVQAPLIPGESSIAAAPNGDVGIAAILSARFVLPGKQEPVVTVERYLTYWAIPPQGLVVQSIKPTIQQAASPFFYSGPSIAFDGNGAAHLAYTRFPGSEKLQGNEAIIDDFVITPSGAAGVGPIGTMSVPGTIESPGIATMAPGPNGEVDCYYVNSKVGTGTDLWCYTLPLGGAWSVPGLVTTSSPGV